MNIFMCRWKKSKYGLTFILVCMLSSLPLPAGAADITATDLWISAAPPVVRVNAGYMKLTNNGTDGVILVGAESPRFARIEMHLSEMKSGTYAMHRQYSLLLEGGKSLTFAPGGLHLMLFDATQSQKPKEKIPLTLIFADGLRIAVKAEVRPLQSGAGHHNH